MTSWHLFDFCTILTFGLFWKKFNDIIFSCNFCWPWNICGRDRGLVLRPQLPHKKPALHVTHNSATPEIYKALLVDVVLCVGVRNVSCDSRMIETNRRQGADYYSRRPRAALANRGSDIATEANTHICVCKQTQIWGNITIPQVFSSSSQVLFGVDACWISSRSYSSGNVCSCGNTRTSVPMQSGTPKPIWQIQIDAGWIL